MHAAHGIGVFDGVHQLTTSCGTKDYIKIRYQGKDVLYVGFSSGLSTTYNSARIASLELKEKYPEATVAGISPNLASLESVREAFRDATSRYGCVDILVNNAAHQGIGKPFVEMSPDYVKEVFSVNVIGGFQVTQMAVTRFFLKQENRGVVVFLSLLLSGCGCRHEWRDATCDAPRTCTKCNESSKPARAFNAFNISYNCVSDDNVIQILLKKRQF